MRLDHLLSREEEVESQMCFTVELSMCEHLMKPSRRRWLSLVRNVVLLTKETELPITRSLLVPMRLWETPVPIPNTTVKTQAADGTALETVWESRWAPDQKENNRYDLKDIKLVLPVIRSFKLLFEVSND